MSEEQNKTETETPIGSGSASSAEVCYTAEHREIMWAERKPDIYGGKNCDEVIPQWYVQAEGDRGGEILNGDIVLDAKTFPPGTKITITVPECPKCGQDVELCKSDGDCNFDWDSWVTSQYQ